MVASNTKTALPMRLSVSYDLMVGANFLPAVTPDVLFHFDDPE